LGLRRFTTLFTAIVNNNLHFDFIYRNIAILRYVIMGASKTDHFTVRQNEMALLMKALAHPARIAIIDYLLQVNTCICGDIVNELPLAQPTVSQHLKELKNAGLIKGNIDGNSICYCIDEDTFLKFQNFLSEVVGKIQVQKNNCC